jgi:hypothetical protein
MENFLWKCYLKGHFVKKLNLEVEKMMFYH